MNINSLFKYVTGIVGLRGATDNTRIGNSGDRLRTEADFDRVYLTPFGGIRVTQPENVFESVFNFDKLPLVWDETLATGGTSTWNTNTNSVDTAVTTTSGSSVIRQTRRRIRYNPARTVRVQLSGNLGGDKANCRRRVGQFDANNGLFFELNGTVKNVVVRSSTSGSVVDTPIAQSSWNLDKLDGTGVSGQTIDLSKHQLFVIDYGWQGIGAVRFGFFINGKVIYCHEFSNANVLTVPFMKTANLPIRTEITNTGTAASATTMSFNCFVVKNEGNNSAFEGITRSSADTALTTVGTTIAPIISLRLNAANITAIVDIIKASMLVQTVDEAVWQVVLNPTLTGATWAQSIGYAQVDTAATAMSGGTVLDSGVISQYQNIDTATAAVFQQVNSFFGASIAGVSDVITLGIRSRTGTADVMGGITWREY